MGSIKCWLLALAAILLLAGTSLAADTKKPALSAQQRKEMLELVTEFRKVRPEPNRRLDVIDRMEKIGPIGLNMLLDILQKEIGKQLSDYRNFFSQAAAAEGVKKLDEETLGEITELRQKILALSDDEELTKEEIVQIGDPGLARLKELVLFNREDVLEKNPALLKRRAPLEVLGKQWERCAMHLLAEQEDDAPDDPKKECADEEKGEEEKELAPPSFADYLVKEEEMATALSMPMDAQTRTVLAGNEKLVGKLDPEESRCVLDLNLTRSLLGLRPLQIDLALAKAARDHSSDMAEQDFFSHESPVSGKKTPWDRAKLVGTSSSAENIALGALDGAAANQIWWRSPGHHKNMLGSHSRVGVGRHGKHWTEMFGQ